MRSTKWGVVLLVVAIAACAQDEAGEQAGAADTTAVAPAPAAEAPAAPANLPAGVTQEMVAQGQQIFTATGNCFTCHGADGKGTSLAPNLTDSEWINVSGAYEDIVTVVRTGVATPKQHPAPMPPMGGASLNDEQIRQVSAYVWAMGGGK